MDVRLTGTQVDTLYTKVRTIKTNGGNPTYTEIGGGVHFSWQKVGNTNTIVVGENGPPKRHKHFKITISGQLVVTLTPDIGYLPISGVQQTKISDVVTLALKLQLRSLVTGNGNFDFNNLGRSAQALEFHKNRIVNRHDTKSVILGITGINNSIAPGNDKTVENGAGKARGFAVYKTDGQNDCYYRNYDIREDIDLEYEEPLRILHLDDGSIKLLRTNDNEIRTFQLG